MRDYPVAPLFQKPTFTEGVKPFRDWVATETYKPSDSLDARMRRAMLRAAQRHLEKGDVAKYRDRVISADLFIKKRSESK